MEVLNNKKLKPLEYEGALTLRLSVLIVSKMNNQTAIGKAFDMLFGFI